MIESSNLKDYLYKKQFRVKTGYLLFLTLKKNIILFAVFLYLLFQEYRSFMENVLMMGIIAYIIFSYLNTPYLKENFLNDLKNDSFIIKFFVRVKKNAFKK